MLDSEPSLTGVHQMGLLSPSGRLLQGGWLLPKDRWLLPLRRDITELCLPGSVDLEHESEVGPNNISYLLKGPTVRSAPSSGT